MTPTTESIALLRARLLKLKTVLETMEADPLTAAGQVSVLRLHKSAILEWRSAHWPNEYAGFIQGIAADLDSYDIRQTLSNATRGDAELELARSHIRSIIEHIAPLLADLASPSPSEPGRQEPDFFVSYPWYTGDHREAVRVLAQGAAQVNAVAKQIGLGRDTVRKLLAKLAAEGFVERDDDRSPYRLTSKAAALPGVKSA